MMTRRLPFVLSDQVDLSWMSTHDFEEFEKALHRELGEELRLCRVARGLARVELVKMLPSKCSDRSLITYELGTRRMTVVRWVELSAGLGVSPGMLLDRALQSAKMALETVVLRIDLHRLLHTEEPPLWPLAPWARNRLSVTPNGVAELHPFGLRELAAALDYDAQDLARRLAPYSQRYPKPWDDAREVVDPDGDEAPAATIHQVDDAVDAVEDAAGTDDEDTGTAGKPQDETES